MWKSEIMFRIDFTEKKSLKWKHGKAIKERKKSEMEINQN